MRMKANQKKLMQAANALGHRMIIVDGYLPQCKHCRRAIFGDRYENGVRPLFEVCDVPSGRWSLTLLESLETVQQGHFDNLKIQGPRLRVWLSRMTIEDGEPYNNKVTVEVKDSNDNWVQCRVYQAR